MGSSLPCSHDVVIGWNAKPVIMLHNDIVFAWCIIYTFAGRVVSWWLLAEETLNCLWSCLPCKKGLGLTGVGFNTHAGLSTLKKQTKQRYRVKDCKQLLTALLNWVVGDTKSAPRDCGGLFSLSCVKSNTLKVNDDFSLPLLFLTTVQHQSHQMVVMIRPNYSVGTTTFIKCCVI